MWNAENTDYNYNFCVTATQITTKVIGRPVGKAFPGFWSFNMEHIEERLTIKNMFRNFESPITVYTGCFSSSMSLSVTVTENSLSCVPVQPKPGCKCCLGCHWCLKSKIYIFLMTVAGGNPSPCRPYRSWWSRRSWGKGLRPSPLARSSPWRACPQTGRWTATSASPSDQMKEK